jgi:hypothetical protein
MSCLRASESKKIQEPRQKTKQLVKDYEEKLRVLNVRLQAGEALQSDSAGTAAQLEMLLRRPILKTKLLKRRLRIYRRFLRMSLKLAPLYKMILV